MKKSKKEIRNKEKTNLEKDPQDFFDFPGQDKPALALNHIARNFYDSHKSDAFKEAVDRKDTFAHEQLTKPQLLYYTRNAFRENLKSRLRTSSEIFQDIYEDPSGAEYWRGWFDSLDMTVADFAHLLAIHLESDAIDKYEQKKDIPSRPIAIYENRRKEILLILQKAAKMKALKFEGETDALLEMNTTAIVSGGMWTSKNNVKYLSQAIIYPPDTLKWFVKVPERAVLLPASLREWYANQSIVVEGERDNGLHSKGAVAHQNQTDITSEQPLQGYKKIAAFLDVSPDTVKKSYKPQGAPIRTQNGRVFAYPSELNKWKIKKSKKNKKSSKQPS